MSKKVLRHPGFESMVHKGKQHPGFAAGVKKAMPSAQPPAPAPRKRMPTQGSASNPIMTNDGDGGGC